MDSPDLIVGNIETAAAVAVPESEKQLGPELEGAEAEDDVATAIAAVAACGIVAVISIIPRPSES